MILSATMNAFCDINITMGTGLPVNGRGKNFHFTLWWIIPPCCCFFPLLPDTDKPGNNTGGII